MEFIVAKPKNHRHISLFLTDILEKCNYVWEQRKLGEIVDRVTRKNQHLVSTLPLTISAQYGLIDQNEFFDKRVASKDVSGYYLINNGEFAYNKSTSSDAPWGAIKRLDRYENGVLSTLYIVFGIKENAEVDSDYLVTYYDTDLWHRGVREIAAEGARNHGLLNIAPVDFFETRLTVPQDIEEQKAIGRYFSELNSLITLHQRKNHSFAILFAYVWEQRKFSKFTFPAGEKNKKDLPLEPYAITNESGFVPQSKAHDEFGYMKNTDRKAYNIVKPNSFAYNPARINVGSIGYYEGVENIIVSSLYEVFQTASDVDDRFLWHWFKSEHFPAWIERLQEGSVRMYFYYDKLCLCNMHMPKLEEQKQMASYFDKLDNLITLHQCKCHLILFLKINTWEQRKLNEIAEKVTEKNRDNLYDEPFTNSAEQGIISQKDYFDREVVNEENLDGYYVVRDDDFVYNPRVSVTAPVGPINRNKLGRNGVMSPLYTVFRTHDINTTYLEHYFKTKCWHLFMKMNGDSGARFDRFSIATSLFMEMPIPYPNLDEQAQIGCYFDGLDKLITLHQCKCYLILFSRINAWEQRKLEDIVDVCSGRDYKHLAEGDIPVYGTGGYMLSVSEALSENDDAIGIGRKGTIDNPYILRAPFWTVDTLFYCIPKEKFNLDFVFCLYQNVNWKSMDESTGVPSLSKLLINNVEVRVPNKAEQEQIGKYFSKIDHLITLHQRRVFNIEILIDFTYNQRKPIKKEIHITIYKIFTKEMTIMPELEALIEQKLIDQLVYGDSQWTYRSDLKTEEDLWANFKYILEQNNKDRLNGENLSDSEFEQVKNQLQFSSFYKAGEWLVGENGKVQVHVQRDTERLHLVVMNHEHIAGGSSVYEVINQYNALKTDENLKVPARDRRFDVTLMINGLPMIHIELKNKQHSYMDGFWQIKKYIGEGKFTGIFSAVQMFVISNGVNTKYFSAASDTELNPKFISGWLDKDNNPVADYLDFAKCILRIPEAHEMIARYTVLDEDAKKLILLRPYQIHAIESIREASKRGKSGYVWHTTGSGKTLTSYKATRNLLMDIPAIDKAIFLIDRKDLDTQTTMAFQAYANNDLIDVDETDNVYDLKKKLKSDDRQVIVTTIQKLQRLITKKLKEGTPEYNKIKNLKIAYVVDECHRAVTPATKRELERFFGNSLWFGFTGTPRFAENPYPQLGDLPRTTEELYGERLHKYTIQHAIHDNAVLGFQVEHNGPKNVADETDSSVYDNETHMLKVLDVILNKSYHKLGFQNGKGQTYEALLTTSSIQLAQKYYELLTRVKNGETSLQIDEKVKQVLPDFPKFAITYSVTENEEGSHVNQQKMQASLDDYNNMFGTKYEVSQIQGYNGNLNKRLARKEPKFKSRSEQLDLVIVVDRLLTGFDAPCLSTIFIDRQPMGPHDLIQAFSRTNRIFDKNKSYGQIVTFQAPVSFKESVDNAVKLYSAGGTKDALLAEWDEIEPAFKKALAALRVSAEKPSDIPAMSKQEKKMFVKIFQNFDRLFAQLKSFTNYEENMLESYGITDEEYHDYAGHYLNVVEELKADNPDADPDDPDTTTEIDQEYELMAYSNTKIDYEYIINLIQNIVTPQDDSEENTPEERQKKIEEVKQYVEELRKDNPKVADIMSKLIQEIELDETKYRGQSILNIVENMKQDCIDQVITDFSITWYASKDDVMYAATHYRNGVIPNESAIKATIDYTSYKAVQERALPKFKYYAQMMADLRKTLDEEIKPLISH